MKLIIYMLLVFISAKECGNNKAQMSNDVATKEMETEFLEQTMQDSTKVTYQAHTRGFFMKIWIEGDSIMISDDYNLKRINTYQFPQEEKAAFLNLLRDTDEKSLKDLKAPTTTFQYDAAPMAYLEITKGDSIYKTVLFDHGKPPKPISKMVEKILSVKTMLEKQ